MKFKRVSQQLGLRLEVASEPNDLEVRWVRSGSGAWFSLECAEVRLVGIFNQ